MALKYEQDYETRDEAARRIGSFDAIRGGFVSHAFRTGAAVDDVRRPAWSPDGRRIAFDARPRARPTAPASIYVAVSGRAPRLIVRNGHSPAWSADGKKIVFVRDLTPTNSEIFTVNANGTGVRRLTYHPGPDFAPDRRPTPRRG